MVQFWCCVLKNLNRLLRIYKTLAFVVFLVIRVCVYIYIVMYIFYGSVCFFAYFLLIA